MTEKILDLLDLTRRKLHYSGFPEISLAFPILELTNDPNEPNLDRVLGLTDIDYVWPSKMDSKTVYSLEFKVNHVKIRIRGGDGKILELERILPTFLHELTHTCVGACQTRQIKCSKRFVPTHLHDTGSTNGYQFNSHTTHFYKKFMEILLVSKELELFHLGSVIDSLNEKSLRKLDDLDLLRASLSIIGTTRLNDSFFVKDLNSKLNNGRKKKGFNR